ncbi:hypothetical protein FRC98_00950 [Lujinxingia vulgaris]|uniref:Uncharacterized protein n=1 Tax=Lujinxingia vulgaris TaxID=2600176 RepID=A0A5C6XC58_9DELT|nr:hypothetical protein [Lujinxingia vulgaris]TXD39001.1 hypothetical protein FRC98_00950 [Lujinxingia vulgaris]
MRRPNLVTGVMAFLGAAMLPGLWMLERAADENAPVYRPELVGCASLGPCLDPTQGAQGVIRLSESQTQVCVSGANLGSGGQVMIDHRAYAADSWSAQQVCVSPGADGLSGGRIWVEREDGLRSNSLGIFGAAQVAGWEVPEEVYPGTLLYVQGEQLEGVGVVGQGATIVRADDDRVAFTYLRPGIYQAQVGTEPGPTIEVLPKLERSCQVGPNTHCSLVINRVESSAQVLSVQVGGLEAEVVRAGEFELSFAWPEGLEPGEHVAIVEMTHGRVEAPVELLAYDAATLVDFSPAGGFIQRRAERLPIFDGYLVAPMFSHFQQSDGPPVFDSYGLARMPLEPAAQQAAFPEGLREGRTPERARYLFDRLVDTTRNPWLSVDDGVLRVMNKSGEADGLQVVTLGPGETPGAWQRTVGGAGGGAFYTFFRVAGARWFGASPVVAVGRPFADVPVDLDLRGVEVAEDAQAALDALTYRDTSVGWVSEEAVFASTCGEAGAPAGVMRLSLVADEVEGTLVASAPLAVRDGLDETRAILGCHGREEGFYWVERHDGVDALFFLGHDAAEAELVVELPADIPGVGDRYDVPRAAPSDPQRWRSGLANFEVLNGGDVVFLMSPTDAPAELVVARWDAAAESWEVGEAQEVVMRDGLGDRCVGPVETLSCMREIGLYGCGPMACDVGLRLPGVQEGVWVRGANFRVIDNAVHVMLEAEHLSRPNHDVWNRHELQYRRMELP